LTFLQKCGAFFWLMLISMIFSAIITTSSQPNALRKLLKPILIILGILLGIFAIISMATYVIFLVGYFAELN
jgi:hypothetical protein